MSVSLTMVPIALALRVVMGKDNFNEWTESNLNPQETNFKSRKELMATLHEAGYDAIPYGPSIKTHFGENNYFIWELRDGKWTALFSKFDLKKDCITLINKLNNIAGRNLFESEEEAFLESKQEAIPKSAIFPTNFTDMILLEQTLQKENIPYQVKDDGTIVSNLQSVTLHFKQFRSNGVIDVEIMHAENLQPIFKQMTILDEAYRRQIQQQTYDHLITHAKNKGFSLEEEIELPDESILITLRVEE